MAWAAVEVGLSIYDAYNTIATLLDPGATAAVKAATTGAFMAGVFELGAAGQPRPMMLRGGVGKNPFKGKTPEQIDKMFKDKGFDPREPDPLNGKGGYVNPETGRSYPIDPGSKYKKGTEYPHVDVNRTNGSKLPKKKYPLGDKLNDNR